jgi:hypothetical protein
MRVVLLRFEIHYVCTLQAAYDCTANIHAATLRPMKPRKALNTKYFGVLLGYKREQQPLRDEAKLLSC